MEGVHEVRNDLSISDTADRVVRVVVGTVDGASLSQPVPVPVLALRQSHINYQSALLKRH